VTVADPLEPNHAAEQLLATLVAVKTSVVDVFTVWMLAELVTDPPSPSVPWVLTDSAPELKKVVGP
jgi:hypothetical protein